MMQESSMRASLFGKHPLSSEYLYMGESSPFVNSIVSWVQVGYEALLKKRRKDISDVLHHLYFANNMGESFVCATLKMSKDSKGRVYPLILLVEVTSTQKPQNYSTLWSRNVEIFKEMESLERVEHLLRHYKVEAKEERAFLDLDENILSAFINEEFLIDKKFYTSIQVDDFIEMMR